LQYFIILLRSHFSTNRQQIQLPKSVKPFFGGWGFECDQGDTEVSFFTTDGFCKIAIFSIRIQVKQRKKVRQ